MIYSDVVKQLPEKIRIIKALAGSKYSDVQEAVKFLVKSAEEKNLATQIIKGVNNANGGIRKSYLDSVYLISSNEEKSRIAKTLAKSKYPSVREVAKTLMESTESKELQNSQKTINKIA